MGKFQVNLYLPKAKTLTRLCFLLVLLLSVFTVSSAPLASAHEHPDARMHHGYSHDEGDGDHHGHGGGDGDHGHGDDDDDESDQGSTSFTANSVTIPTTQSTVVHQVTPTPIRVRLIPVTTKHSASAMSGMISEPIENKTNQALPYESPGIHAASILIAASCVLLALGSGAFLVSRRRLASIEEAEVKLLSDD